MISFELIQKLLWGIIKYLWKNNKTQLIQNIKGVNKAQLLTQRNNNTKTAVCFIHGFGGDAKTTWGQFPELIKTEDSLNNWDIYSLGYNTNLMPDIKGIWAAKPDIQKLADNLRTSIEFHFKPSYDRLVIVAHSMGGLVTQRCLLDMDNQEVEKYIHSVILFGTPSDGLKKARFSFFNNQIKDMNKGSDFIKNLRTEWNERYADIIPFVFIAAAGDLDEFVPSSSSLDVFPERCQQVTVGNHSDIVKPEDRDHLSFKIVKNTLETHQYYDGRWDGAEVALEMGEFTIAKNKFEGYKDSLDRNGQIKYAFSLEALGDTKQAIKYLSEQMGKPDTDVMGTLGGRWKRLWLSTSNANHADHAMQLYTDAYELSEKKDNKDQVYYHAINLAFLHLLYKNDTKESKKFAQIAKENSEASEDHLWKYATLGEASIYLRNEDAALKYYKKALDTNPPPRARESMYIQWQRIVKHMGLTNLETRLKYLFFE